MTVLRRATADDAKAIATVHRTAMRISLAFLPELHTADEDLRFFSQKFLATNEVWVAETDGVVVGYIGFDDGWINHLYLLPEHQGQGLGPQLLALALSDGRRRKLWTFQRNTRARRFYEDRGFVLLELTDGSGNEEKTPDALYEWRPA
ncbi:GNAT family N-acetyltransferase [Phenylobacterium sp.]|uniref:GNAT family N-acetyltransferase n=1 Tax=Phenylobacterium sp. TaxID=1871053 RepID=UPI002F4247F8